MSNTPDPFGYFKAEPFGWTDCAETDDDAIPLYDKVAIRLIQKQRDELLAALEDIAQWTERYTQPGHPISTVARRAISSVKGGAA